MGISGKAAPCSARANPVGHAGLLAAAVNRLAPTLIVLVVPNGKDAKDMRLALRDISLPNAVIQEIGEAEGLPISSPAHGKTSVDRRVTAYVCIGPQCSLPLTDPAQLVETITTARQTSPHEAPRNGYLDSA